MAVSRCSCSMLHDPPDFYHPYLTNLDMVTEVMRPYLHVNGAFLVRDSFSKAGALTVSAVHQRGIKHFHIMQSGLKYILDRQFMTLQDLVQFYSQHDVPNLEGITGLRLTFPVVYSSSFNLPDAVRRRRSSSSSHSSKKYSEQPAIPDDSTVGGLYYSQLRDVDRKLSSDLMAHLTQLDNEDHGADGKCICGLYLVDSELPYDWSMHISTECGTEGRLFFTSPTNETSWELPGKVLNRLNTDQRNRILQLMIGGRHHIAQPQHASDDE